MGTVVFWHLAPCCVTQRCCCAREHCHGWWNWDVIVTLDPVPVVLKMEAVCFVATWLSAGDCRVVRVGNTFCCSANSVHYIYLQHNLFYILNNLTDCYLKPCMLPAQKVLFRNLQCLECVVNVGGCVGRPWSAPRRSALCFEYPQFIIVSGLYGIWNCPIKPVLELMCSSRFRLFPRGRHFSNCQTV
jgi:hypothetical protein